MATQRKAAEPKRSKTVGAASSETKTKGSQAKRTRADGPPPKERKAKGSNTKGRNANEPEAGADKRTATHAVHYPGLSPKSYEHPADRAAISALKAIPGLDTAVRWLIEQGYERALFQEHLAASVRIGPDQLPETWRAWINVVGALDLGHRRTDRIDGGGNGAEGNDGGTDGGDAAGGDVPTLYVAQGPHINAMAIGSQHPYVVVTSRCHEVTDHDERRVVLGHEAGHILSGHTTYHTALQILLNLSLPVLGPGALPLAAVRLSLLEWFRAAELTCDRAAALAVDDPELVCRTLMVMGAGLPSSQLSLPAFLRQAQEYQTWDDGPDRLRRFLANLKRTHSLPVRRAGELMSWIASGEYDRIRRGEYVRRDEEPAVREAAVDAVVHYSDRFREIFSSAGDSVAKAGSRFDSWLRG